MAKRSTCRNTATAHQILWRAQQRQQAVLQPVRSELGLRRHFGDSAPCSDGRRAAGVDVGACTVMHRVIPTVCAGSRHDNKHTCTIRTTCRLWRCKPDKGQGRSML